MKALYLILAMALISSCGGFFPGAGILVPHSPGGYEMHASGLDGSYEYRFGKDGTYSRETILPSGEKEKAIKGTWKWEKQSRDHAVLILDNDLKVHLHFTTSSHANATVPWSTRLFPVEFEKL